MHFNVRSLKALTLAIFTGVACYILFFMERSRVHYVICSKNTAPAASILQLPPKPAVVVADVTTYSGNSRKGATLVDKENVSVIPPPEGIIFNDKHDANKQSVSGLEGAGASDATHGNYDVGSSDATRGNYDVGASYATHGNYDVGPSDATHGNYDVGASDATHGNYDVGASDATHGNYDVGASDATHGNYDVSIDAARRAYRPIQPRVLPCHWTPESVIQNTRYQAFLTCSPSPSAASSSSSASGLPTVFFKSVRADVTPSITSLDDVGCLRRLIAERCVERGKKVPRVAHYVRFGKDEQSVYELPLDAFISLVSVARFLQPCAILIHGDQIPSGRYWRALLQIVPNIFHVPMERPTRIFHKTVNKVEHSSDIARIQILQQYGGFYVDMDYLILRSLNALLNHTMVTGTEIEGENFCNGFLVAEPNATFLGLWMANYTDFDDNQWAEHSSIRLRMLSLDYPHLVHVVDTFFKPNYRDTPVLLDRNTKYNWYDLFGLHLYTRLHSEAILNQPRRIDYQINTAGDMVRHVLYGDQHACIDL